MPANSTEVTVRQMICKVLMMCLVIPLLAADEAPKDLPMFKAKPDGKVDIFNGKDLSGWDKDADYWSVDNGEILAKATEKHPYSYLTTQKAVGDFRLVVEMKLTPNSENSGIQFRSVRIGKNEMKGMQADAGKGWWGHLYEEHERALLTKKSGEEWVKEDDWNTYEILAVGPKVQTAINGHLCVDMNDEKFDRKGVIGFQMHAGGPQEIRFRKLELELNPKFELKTVKQ